MITKNTKAVLNEAEVLLKDLEAASRGRRLARAEAEIRDAAKPKNRAQRSAALKRAEAEVAGPKRSDPRCVYRDMTVAKQREPEKPDAQAAITQYLREQFAARRK